MAALDNTSIIKKFYTSFANRDVESMVSLYSNDVVFHDPAFGELKGKDAKDMWRLLISRGDGTTQISYQNVLANQDTGSVDWRAEYLYGPHKRKVINQISAEFVFSEGKITKHTDTFDLWKWSRQALGISGWLLGWSSFMRNKIQAQTNSLLRKYQTVKD